jgi:hypothetical protein
VTPAAKVFQGKKAYFDTTEANLATISIDLGVGGSVSAVTVGRVAADAGEYALSGSVLTLAKSFLKKVTAGEKTLKVTVDSATIPVSLFAASKVITTAQEFQDINSNLTGYYILGNDIDLSSIHNFEPLGYYFTETDTRNAYFHGVLEGNGYSVKNATVEWSDSTATNYGVYSGTGTTMFSSDAHKNGDNIGLFQIIGSSGVVRDVNFKNIKVRGRTIVGVIAGNCSGTVSNCTLDSACSVEMGTHFYDDDCNMGGAFGIVAGSGNVNNVISQATSQQIGATGSSTVNNVSIEKAGIYLDWSSDYIGKTGNGWDHGTPATNDNPWWKQCAVDKTKTDGSTKVTDSNGSPTDGQYAFVGKCWGSVSSCVAKTFKITPMDGTARDVYFGQTHLAANKSTSGSTNLGTLSNNLLLDATGLKAASNYSAYDKTVWAIVDGSVPTLISQFVLK